ncbi:MAG TPA: hypothetical protein VNN73_12125 [Blastocatellia bacterium]|nr:hypothetical protein [Blastocatellia bacterium]
MKNARKLTPIIDAAVKRADKNAMTERVFYDEVSDRLFVAIVKGSRQVEITLPARCFENGSADQIDSRIKEAVKRLDRTPIG